MKNILSEISTLLNAQRRKDIAIYLIFVVVSAVFWLMLTLNNDVQETYNVDVRVVNMPDSATLINDFPAHIKVSIKDKGSSLMKYSLGSHPSIDVDFNEFKTDNGILRVPGADLRNMVSKTFGSNGDVITINPDSLMSRYTYLPGKRVPIISRIQSHANFKYIINGDVELSQDSAVVYSTKNELGEIDCVYTAAVNETNLMDSTAIDVPLVSDASVNVKIVPSHVKALIPVEPLIAKSITVPVIAKGLPANVSLVTFPGKVELKYLVPSSIYKKVQDFHAEVYYDDVDKRGTKLPVYITDSGWPYGEVSLSCDSVEYIIENK